ncbi:hypothetical protein, partial [Burkholderia vietnamiensis]|uniref:hypothetical protein n=1 Tax=Burkholderia vietnamiensis TaxID=60552 RepID=UPI001CC71349
MKKPAQGGLLHFLAERTGLAYIPQAAVARARATLRVPPEAAQAASSAPQSRARMRAREENANEKARTRRAFSFSGGADG